MTVDDLQKALPIWEKIKAEEDFLQALQKDFTVVDITFDGYLEIPKHMTNEFTQKKNAMLFDLQTWQKKRIDDLYTQLHAI